MPTTVRWRFVAATLAALAAGIILGSTESVLRAQDGSTVWFFENVSTGNLVPGCVSGMTLAGFDIDPLHRPVVAWREENGCGGTPGVFWARRDGGLWDTREYLSPRRYQGGAQGDYAHHLILRPSDGNPFLIHADVGDWNSINTYRVDLGAYPNGGVSDYLEPLVGAQNCAYVTYSLAFAPAGQVPQWGTGLALCSGTGPIKVNGVNVNTSVYNPIPALAVTTDGTRHLLWNSGSDLHYTRWPGADQAPTTYPPLFTSIRRHGGEIRLAADGAVLHALLRGSENQSDWDPGTLVYFRSSDGGQTWSAPEYVDPYDIGVAETNLEGIHTNISLAVDADGIPAVTYWKWNQHLWFAKRDGAGGTWSRSFVTAVPNDNGPRDNQVRFDADGTPVVAFYDSAANALRLARPVPVGFTPSINVAVSTAFSPAQVSPGGSSTLTLTVRNTSDVNVSNVVLTHELPTGLTVGTPSPGPGADSAWHIGLLTSGATYKVTIAVTAPSAGDFLDVARVSMDGDAESSDNVAIGGLSVGSAVPPGTNPTDLQATLTATPVLAQIGAVVGFVAKVTNVGTAAVGAVPLTVTLPAELSLVETAPGPSGGDVNAPTFALGALSPGQSAWVLVRALLPPAYGTFTASATLAVPGDTNAANDQAFATVRVAPDACFVAPAGLVGRWRADGAGTDEVAGRDAALFGGLGFDGGHLGQAFVLDGATAYAQVADDPALRPARFTVGAWVFPTSFDSGLDTVIAKGASGTDPALPYWAATYWLGMNDGFPTVYTHHQPSVAVTTRAPSRLRTGQWYHLAASYDGATVRLFVDGVQVAATVQSQPLVYDQTPVPLAFGSDWESGHASVQLFNGLIDDITLHNRALTDGEVMAMIDGAPASCVVPSNAAPKLVNPGDQAGAEGDTIALTLVASDPDGDALAFSATGLPPGLAIDASSGAITGRLGYDAAGSYTVTVTATDGALSDAVMFDWTVTNTNRAPAVTAPGNQTSAEGDTVALALVASDPDGDTLTFGATGLPRGLAVDPDSGVISGSLGYDAAGVYALTVTASDSALSHQAGFSWEVTNTNRPPGFAAPGPPAHVEMDEGTTTTITVSATDPDADPLTLAATGLPAFATFVDDGDGAGHFTFTPDFTNAGTYVGASVTVSDGNLAASASFEITVHDVNRVPVAADDAYAVDYGTILTVVTPGVLGDDGDPDGDHLTAVLVTGPGHGTLTLGADGAFTYTPSAGFRGRDSFSYNANDGTADSAIATVTITVNVVYKVNDVVTTAPSGITVSIPLSYTPDWATPVLVTTASHGQLTLTADYATYTSDPSYWGTDSFTYRVVDALGAGASAPGTVSITVERWNHPPFIYRTGLQTQWTLPVGYPVNVRVYASDADGDPILFSADRLPPGLSIDTNGRISGAPTQAGTYGSMIYAVDVPDGLPSGMDMEAIAWTIAPNQIPVVTNPGPQETPQRSVVRLQLAASDPDGGAVTFVRKSTLPAGIGLTQGGLLWGLAEVAATLDVVIGARDAVGAETAIAFPWTVTPQSRPDSTDAVLQDSTVGAVNPRMVLLNVDGELFRFDGLSRVGLDLDVVDVTPVSERGWTKWAPGAAQVRAVTLRDVRPVTGAVDELAAWASASIAGTAPPRTFMLGSGPSPVANTWNEMYFRIHLTDCVAVSVLGESGVIDEIVLQPAGLDFASTNVSGPGDLNAYIGNQRLHALVKGGALQVAASVEETLPDGSAVMVEGRKHVTPLSLTDASNSGDRLTYEALVRALLAGAQDPQGQDIRIEQGGPTPETLATYSGALVTRITLFNPVGSWAMAGQIVPTYSFTWQPARVQTAGNTPEGSYVSVAPVDPGTGQTPVSITFDTVTSAGQTVVRASTGWWREFGLGTATFDLATTASFTQATVCFSYDPGLFVAAEPPRLYHLEGSGFVDITTSVDPVAHTICGRVSSFSPFVVATPLNHPPVVDAGPDQIVEAESAGSTSVTLVGSASDPDSDPLTYAWTGPFGTTTGAHVTVALPLGMHVISLVVEDGKGGTGTDEVEVTIKDTVPPDIVITTPVEATYRLFQVVEAAFACTDAVSGSPTCQGTVPVGAAIDTSTEGDHTFTVTATDASGNASTATVSYTVVGELTGRMKGEGHLQDGPDRHLFEFQIEEQRIGQERGSLRYWTKGGERQEDGDRVSKNGVTEREKEKEKGKEQDREQDKSKSRDDRRDGGPDRFESTAITAIGFWNDPSVQPGRKPRPDADSVMFAGTGKWNRQAGYTFEARATDLGEPGRGHDTFALTIRDPQGAVVAEVLGTLAGGNIQSLPVKDKDKERK